MANYEEPLIESLPRLLEEQSYLYDLHTHLMGMGNANFWIDTILMDEFIMPTNNTFNSDPLVRKALGPLVWTKSTDHDSGFVNRQTTAEFFAYLVKNNVFRNRPESFSDAEDSGRASELMNSTGLETIDYEETMGPLRHRFPPALHELVTKDLYHRLINGGLEFKSDFSYDVILTLSDLSKGLGIENSDCDGFVQLDVIEKFGGHSPNLAVKFQHWIVFNARKQKLEIVYGMQVEQLRTLIHIDPNYPSAAAKLARAHLNNAFSMYDADYHKYHGCFTPEFYPRRFALKDSIYSQRLDVLAALIGHVMQRY